MEFILEPLKGRVTRQDLMRGFFNDDPIFPAKVKTFGAKIRAARMENFMLMKELAHELGVNEYAAAGWELGESQPSSDKLAREQAFLDLVIITDSAEKFFLLAPYTYCFWHTSLSP